MSERLDRVLVVGASLAGLRAAEALRAEGFESELIVLGDEPHLPYDRPPLSKGVLAGTLDAEQVTLPIGADLGAELVFGERATGLDPARRRISTSSGREIGFDGLVIATGSRPRRLPGLDPGEDGVHELRTLDDALRLRAELRPGARLAIVGAGFVGIEVASTALGLGVEVEIVSLDPPLAIAGELISGVAARQLRARGVPVHGGRSVARVERSGAIRRLVLDDGSGVEADLVLVAIGAVPATEWLRDSGLALDDGVCCRPCCTVEGAERIVAAGDVARWRRRHPGGESLRIEHWSNAVEQARAAASTLLRGSSPERAYAPLPSFWSEHFDTRVQSLGMPGLADRYEIVDGDLEEGRFAAEAYRGEALVGAVAYGMPAALLAISSKLQNDLPQPERGVTV